MIIHFSPQLGEGNLKISKNGDTLVINGESFNFSSLDEGDLIKHGNIPCPYIVGDVSRTGGKITLTLLMPYSDANAPPSVTFPESVLVTEDGPIGVATDVDA